MKNFKVGQTVVVAALNKSETAALLLPLEDGKIRHTQTSGWTSYMHPISRNWTTRNIFQSDQRKLNALLSLEKKGLLKKVDEHEHASNDGRVKYLVRVFELTEKGSVLRSQLTGKPK